MNFNQLLIVLACVGIFLAVLAFFWWVAWKLALYRIPLLRELMGLPKLKPEDEDNRRSPKNTGRMANRRDRKID